jgi:hypothetical protein
MRVTVTSPKGEPARPSAIPPAAITGTGRMASTMAGALRRARLYRAHVSRPPRPCAIMASTPLSAATTASATEADLRYHLNVTPVGIGDEGPGISSEQAEGSEARRRSRRRGLLPGGTRWDEVGKQGLASKSLCAPNLLADERRWQANRAER